MWRLLLGTMGVKSLVQGLNAAATAGFEPRTVWSEVWRRNRLATAPLTVSRQVCRQSISRLCAVLSLCCSDPMGAHFDCINDAYYCNCAPFFLFHSAEKATDNGRGNAWSSETFRGWCVGKLFKKLNPSFWRCGLHKFHYTSDWLSAKQKISKSAGFAWGSFCCETEEEMRILTKKTAMISDVRHKWQIWTFGFIWMGKFSS